MAEARVLDQPQAGYWLVRLGRGCPLVPACIRADENGELHAFIVGEMVPLDQVWHRKGTPISAAEYAYQVADIAWCHQYAPNDPRCNPRKPVMLTALPPIKPE